MWRLMVLLTIALSLAIMAFDLQPFERHAASATLYWVGLRRGHFIPDPDAAPGTPLPAEAQGWLLSPSAEAYLIIAFLAALQFFYNTGPAGAEEDSAAAAAAAVAPAPAALALQPPEQWPLPPARDASSYKTVTFATQESGVMGEEEAPGAADPVGVAAAEAAAVDGAMRMTHADSTASSVSIPSEPPSPGIIDNTRAIAPRMTTLIEMLYNGKIAGGDEQGPDGDAAADAGSVADEMRPFATTATTSTTTSFDNEPMSPSASPLAASLPFEATRPDSPPQQHHQQRPSSPPQQQPSLRRASVTSRMAGLLRPWTVLSGVYHLLHRAVLTLLAGGAAFAFELCVALTVVAALCHADLISLLYLALFVLLVALPRPTLRRHWRLLIHALALLVLAEYMFILRLPPAISYESQVAASLLGSRQCSIFAQYSPPDAQQGPYSYGQWFGLCITDDALVMLDFIVLVLAIIQHKRFKAGACDHTPHNSIKLSPSCSLPPMSDRLSPAPPHSTPQTSFASRSRSSRPSSSSGPPRSSAPSRRRAST